MTHRALAKTTQPTVAGAMRRLRLFRRLDSGRQRAVTWVWGPPGAGKTTLVASYLAERRLRKLWYQVDAGDVDAATVFYYLGRAAPRRRHPLPLLTPEYRPGLEVFARGFFRQLYERLKPPFVLVLDNYQEAPAEALLHDILRQAAEELPGGASIVVVSRTEPPATLARLRLHRGLDVIDWPELRLTWAEAAGLVRTLPGRQPAALTVRRLHELADGWIAGFVLLLEREVANPPSLHRLGSAQLLFDYFAGEIFRKSDPRTQEVLLATSFPPVVTAGMAKALTGRPDAGEVIADLQRRNYFTNSRAGADGVYEYHPLFREFLLTEARRVMSAERVAEICHAAVGLLEGAGEVEAAAELLHNASAWEALGAFSCRHAANMLAQGRVETVERWLASLPESVFATLPWLLYWRGICYLGRRPQDCSRDAEQALAAFRRQRSVEGTRLAWSLLVINQLMVGKPDLVDTSILQFDELLAELPGRAPQEIEARVAVSMVAAIAFRQSNHPDGPRWAARALELTRSQPDLMLRSMAATSWVIYHWYRADISKASLVIKEMRAIMRRRDVPSVVALHAAVPVLWHEMLSALPSYRQTVIEMREYVKSTGLSHALCTTLVCWGAFAALSDGDLDTASAWIREMGDEFEDWGPVYRVAYHGLRTLEALERGDLRLANTHERELAQLGYTSGMHHEECLARVTAAYVCHQRGTHGEAHAHLKHALHVAAAIESPYLEWVVRLAEAYLLLEQGQDAEAVEALRAAMALGSAGGFVNSHVWRPAMMARLCARALEAGIEPRYVRDLVKRRRLACEAAVALDSWPWPVKVFTLGRFAVLSDDRPLRSSGKAQRKPLALLKAIAILGTPGIREERLMDILWPDSEGDAARRALATAVFRLRRLLGYDAAVVRDGGEISLNPAYCWVDTWAVERLLDQATAAAGADGKPVWAKVRKWVEQAAALYRGPLLGGATDEIGNGPTDRLRARLVRQLLLLARHDESAGDWTKAAEILEQALRVDPCSEEAYRSLITAYGRLGRPMEAQSTYRRCRDALQRELGVWPSAATEATLREAHFRAS